MEESEEPNFSAFFEEQANVKREHGKEFLEYIGKYANKICLPVFKVSMQFVIMILMGSLLGLENKTIH